MHFPLTLHPNSLNTLGRGFFAIVDQKTWQKRLHEFDKLARKNPFFEQFLSERHAIELQMARVNAFGTKTGHWPVHNTHDQMRLYFFMAMIVNVYERSTAAAKATLAGRIKRALQDEYGFADLQHEMDVASKLIAMGYDVEFTDLEKTSRVDFLARKGDVEIEIECKTITADLSRKIHRRPFIDVAGKLASQLKRLFVEGVGYTVRVTLSGTLHRFNHALATNMVKTVRAMLNGEQPSLDPSFSVRIEQFNIQGSPFDGRLGPDDVTYKYVAAYANAAPPNIVWRAEPGRAAVILIIESALEDNVIANITETFRRPAKEQFTGTRPAMFYVNILELDMEQLVPMMMKLANNRSNFGVGTGDRKIPDREREPEARS